MIKRFTIGDLRLTFTCARITKVIGVNSRLDDDRHILMWDFDDTTLEEVKDALGKVQFRYFLSDIHILETKKDTNFIAYCFTALNWRRVVEIIAATGLVDKNFFKYGVYREKFTLRVSPKNDRKIKFNSILPGYELPNCSPEDLNSWVKYETLKGG